MHIPRTDGIRHSEGPLLRPGSPLENVVRPQGPTAGEILRVLPQLDTALFREFSEKDVLKIMEVVERVSTQAAAFVPAAQPLPELDTAKSISVDHRSLSPSSVPPTSPDLQTDEPAGNVHVARLHADARLAEAADALSQPHHPQLRDWDGPPEALLRVSQDIYDQGGYLNYLRSGAMSQLLLEGLQPPLLIRETDAPVVARDFSSWRRFIKRQRLQLPRPWLIGLLGLLVVFLLYVLLR